MRPEDAADASGLLATVAQLGQLIGVASFGTLFLNRLESFGPLGPYSSAEAFSVCAWALAGNGCGGSCVRTGTEASLTVLVRSCRIKRPEGGAARTGGVAMPASILEEVGTSSVRR
ncbi:hypothetical protein GCM10017687_19960 [Streptomyces echinatus]